MNAPQLCPDCGSEIPTGSPAGMCPKCMLQAGFESQPPQDARFQATAPSPQANSGFVPPTTAELAKLFPQLEILELLGQGGMGAVYKARQKGLDRLVAVKILPPEIGRDPAFAERFTREARALAKLNHPNIVSVYDFGDVAGQFYFLMEYVDGVNLRQAIRAGQTTPQECLAIVPQICDALQFAHDEGVVHRDIKPENILLDKKGRVKIADFGLAKLLGQDTTDHTLTGTNQVMGTMRYMAPEQMFGSKMVDHRADIYSLGVVFYELLTGEVPMGRFAAPSKKVQIDVRLDEVVLRALEREPEQRYQQAGEVKTAIEHASIRNEPYRPQPTTLPEANLSRTALIGAIWTPAVWLLTIAIIVGFVIYIESYPGKLHIRNFLDITTVICSVVAIIITAIGTTLMGAIAIRQISHSQGKLYGMRLAIADLLLYPLLLLDCLVFALVAGLLFLAVSAIEIKAIDNSQAGIGLRVLFSSFIPIPIIVWIDYLIARAVWRWATGWKAESRYIASKPMKTESFSLPSDKWSVTFQSWSGFIRQSVRIILAIVYLWSLFFLFSFTGGSSIDEVGRKVFHRVGMPTPWLEFTNYAGPLKHGFDWTIHIFSWPVLAAVVGAIALALSRTIEKAEKGKAHSMQWHYCCWGLLLAINIGLALFSTSMMPALKLPSATANSASTNAASKTKTPSTAVEIEQSSKATVDENGSSNTAKLKMKIPVTEANNPLDKPLTMIGGGSGSKGDGLEILSGTNYLVPNQPALTFSTVKTYEEPTRLAFAAVFKHDIRFGKPFKMPANAKQSGIGNPQAAIQQIIEWQGKQVTIDYEIKLDTETKTVASEWLRVNGEEHDVKQGHLLIIDFDASPPKITYSTETLSESLLNLKADSNELVEILKREVPVMLEDWRKKEVIKN